MMIGIGYCDVAMVTDNVIRERLKHNEESDIDHKPQHAVISEHFNISNNVDGLFIC